MSVRMFGVKWFCYVYFFVVFYLLLHVFYGHGMSANFKKLWKV